MINDQGKPCRYGLECTRPNCKFWHGSRPLNHGAEFTGISSQHWVPSQIRLKVNPEGGLECLETEQNNDESLLVSFTFCGFIFVNSYFRFDCFIS